MTTTRIVIETPCDCAEAYGREHRNLCNSPHRRTLTEGQYVLIERECGEWPEWAVGYLDGELFETDDDEGQLACVILDALSDHTEGET